MKHIFPLLLLLASILYISSCANQGSPGGGPRDTIPPIFLGANPPHKSLNYKKREFQFEFDERINAEQVRTKLNITPFVDNKFKSLVKKNILILTFEGDFEDSTTYTFNFADGVGDITEKNPVVNFTYAFSTGPIIDSMYVSGTVKELYTDEKLEEILVGLYAIEDSTDLFTDKPRYFMHTDEEGTFRIENIKSGRYRIYAFEDKDKNLKNDPQKEMHGFIADTIDLTSPKDSLEIKLQLIDATQPEFVRAKNTGLYFDVLYNKYLIDYQLDKINKNSKLAIPPHSFFKENSIIRFYPNENFPKERDSLQVKITVKDSLDNQKIDTVYIQFKESKRKPEAFKFTFTPSNKFKIKKSLPLKFEFSKPIKNVFLDSISYAYDTIKTVRVPDSLYTWNTNKTELKLELILDRSYLPNYIDSLKTVQLKQDSIAKVENPQDTLPKTHQPININNQFNIKIAKGAFVTVDNDTTELKEKTFDFLKAENTGQISGEVETEYTSYILQLINTDHKVIAQKNTPEKFTFAELEPGKYAIRILIDTNEDGNWSAGNILKNEAPEPIIFPTPFIDVKAGWFIELFKADKIKF